MIELIITAVAAVCGAGWCYWKRCERIQRIKSDQEYWDKVRRECPSCHDRVETRRRSEACDSPVSEESPQLS